ncbi:MAG: hypothetical protein ACLSA6_06470 [Holdemania massiliensis]
MSVCSGVLTDRAIKRYLSFETIPQMTSRFWPAVAAPDVMGVRNGVTRKPHAMILTCSIAMMTPTCSMSYRYAYANLCLSSDRRCDEMMFDDSRKYPKNADNPCCAWYIVKSPMKADRRFANWRAQFSRSFAL